MLNDASLLLEHFQLWTQGRRWHRWHPTDSDCSAWERWRFLFPVDIRSQFLHYRNHNSVEYYLRYHHWYICATERNEEKYGRRYKQCLFYLQYRPINLWPRNWRGLWNTRGLRSQCLAIFKLHYSFEIYWFNWAERDRELYFGVV